MANHASTPEIAPRHRLSSLIRDPVVRAAFERAERDYGQSFAIPNDPPHALDGGAAERIREAAEGGAS